MKQSASIIGSSHGKLGNLMFRKIHGRQIINHHFEPSPRIPKTEKQLINQWATRLMWAYVRNLPTLRKSTYKKVFHLIKNLYPLRNKIDYLLLFNLPFVQYCKRNIFYPHYTFNADFENFIPENFLPGRGLISGNDFEVQTHYIPSESNFMNIDSAGFTSFYFNTPRLINNYSMGINRAGNQFFSRQITSSVVQFNLACTVTRNMTINSPAAIVSCMKSSTQIIIRIDSTISTITRDPDVMPSLPIKLMSYSTATTTIFPPQQGLKAHLFHSLLSTDEWNYLRATFQNYFDS